VQHTQKGLFYYLFCLAYYLNFQKKFAMRTFVSGFASAALALLASSSSCDAFAPARFSAFGVTQSVGTSQKMSAVEDAPTKDLSEIAEKIR
jgi:hypothetical protein